MWFLLFVIFLVKLVKTWSLVYIVYLHSFNYNQEIQWRFVEFKPIFKYSHELRIFKIQKTICNFVYQLISVVLS